MVPVHDRVEPPVPPLTDTGLRKQLRLVEFSTTETATVLAKPLTGETLMEDSPEVIALTETDAGFDARAKSWTRNVTVEECERLALVAVTATWIVDVDEKLHDRVALPEPTRLEGAIVQEVLLVDRATDAEKPFDDVTLIVDVPVEPTSTVTLVGFAETV